MPRISRRGLELLILIAMFRGGGVSGASGQTPAPLELGNDDVMIGRLDSNCGGQLSLAQSVIIDDPIQRLIGLHAQIEWFQSLSQIGVNNIEGSFDVVADKAI